MAIFDIYKETDDITSVEESFDDVYGHEDSLMEILHESSYEFAQLRASMYISDCIIENRVLEGADASVLYENFLTDLFDKIKELFITFLNRVKDFFKKLIDNLKLFFTHGKKFAEKYGKQIMDKKVTGFEYEGYKYTYGAGESYVAEIYTECLSFGKILTDSMKDLSVANMKRALKEVSKMDEIPTVEQVKEYFLSDFRVDNVRELVDQIYKKFRSGATAKEIIKDFKANSKEQMLRTIKESNNIIKSIEKDRNHITTLCTNMIKTVDAAKRKLKNETDEEYGKIATIASVISGSVKFAGSIALTATRVKISIVKEMTTVFESILKKYLRYKGEEKATNESAIYDETDSDSILESALKYL